MPAAEDPRTGALRRLPAAYSLALRLRDAGLSADLIAECVAVEPEALGPLMAVAEAKLTALLAPAEGEATRADPYGDGGAQEGNDADLPR